MLQDNDPFGLQLSAKMNGTTRERGPELIGIRETCLLPHACFLTSSCLASASEMKSWRMAGGLLFCWGGLSSQRLICRSTKGPIARSSVSDRFCATTSVTSSGHRKAARAARRNARERMPLSDSASRASSSAMSVFDSTFENRFRPELQALHNHPLTCASAALISLPHTIL